MKKRIISLFILSIISIIIISLNTVVNAEYVKITNIHWGTGDKENVLMWDKVSGATQYDIICINNTTNARKGVTVVNTNQIDLSECLLKAGKYSTYLIAYKGTEQLSSASYAPSKEIETNTYVITCKIPTSKAKYASYTQKVYYYTEETETFELETPEDLENYKFNGWTGNGIKKQMKVIVPKGSTGDKTYTAEWTEKEYNIYFDSQGGTSTESKKCKYNSSLGTLPTTTKDYYDFKGWYTNPTRGIQITSSTNVTGETTYYAHWTPTKYNVSAYVKNEDGSIGKNLLSTTYTIESEEFELENPTFTDGWFEGWIGEDITEPVQNIVIPKGTTGNKKYYALFKKDPCSERHTVQKVIEKATPYKNGRIYFKCSICGKELTDEWYMDSDEYEPDIILRPDFIKIYQTSFVYDGKPKYPSIRVGIRYDDDYIYYDEDGKKCVTEFVDDLEKGKDYTVTYKNNTNIGTGTVTINFTGNYEGQITKTFNILPPPTKIVDYYPESKKATVLWKKADSIITGYQIQYSMNYNLSNAKTITIANNKTTQTVIKGLKNNKNDDFYYIRIRTYKIIGNTTKYSSWSETSFIYAEEPRINFKKINIYRGEKIKLEIFNVLPNAKIKWKSKNTKIVTVSKNGKIKGKKLGTTTITAKCNGKTYKCKVTVGYQKPDFYATTYDYDTRNNYFVILVKNNTNKNLSIQKGTTKIEDFDYKTFDRKIKLSKSVTIKPGKQKKIKFKIIGRTTWYKFDDFTIFYKIKFDGKTYDVKTETFYSKYKSGKKWKNTFNNLDAYQSWNYKVL